MMQNGRSSRLLSEEVITVLNRGANRIELEATRKENARVEVRKQQITEARELRAFIRELEERPEVVSLRRYLGLSGEQFPLHHNGWVAGWRMDSVALASQISGSIYPSREESPCQVFRRYREGEIRRLEICSKGICVFSYEGGRLALDSRRHRVRTLSNMWGARLCGVDPELMVRSISEVIAAVANREGGAEGNIERSLVKLT